MIQKKRRAKPKRNIRVSMILMIQVTMKQQPQQAALGAVPAMDECKSESFLFIYFWMKNVI